MIFSLTKRHMRIFFRNRSAVFFSVLSPMILFALYFFFLGNMNLADLKEQLPYIDKGQLQLFLNSWVYAGIVMTVAVTTGLAALGVFVDDRESGRFVDFAVSPVPRWKITVSYLLATVAVSALITTVIYIAAQTYLVVQGAPLPTIETIMQIVGRYLLVAFSFAALSSFLVTFIKSNAVFTSVSIVIGAGIGFVAGIYVPLGVLSASIANSLNALPFAQAAALLREPFVSKSLESIGEGQPAQVVQELTDTYGLNVVVGNHTLETPTIMLLLLAIGMIALVFAVVRISRKLR